MSKCETCKWYRININSYCPLCNDYSHYQPNRVPQTNGDRIRTMTDEQLAKEIPELALIEKVIPDTFLKWLQQRSDGDDNG